MATVLIQFPALSFLQSISQYMKSFARSQEPVQVNVVLPFLGVKFRTWDQLKVLIRLFTFDECDSFSCAEHDQLRSSHGHFVSIQEAPSFRGVEFGPIVLPFSTYKLQMLKSKKSICQPVYETFASSSGCPFFLIQLLCKNVTISAAS